MRQLTSFRSQAVKQVTFYKSTWSCFFKSDLGTSEPRSLYLITGLGAYLFREAYHFAVFGVDLQICTQPNTKAPLVLLKMPPKAHSALKTMFCGGLVQDQWVQSCTKSRQTGEGLPVWKGRWSGATSPLIRQSNKWSTETVLKLWEVTCYSHSAHGRGWEFFFGPKVTGIAMKQELSITVHRPVFYWADVVIRTITAETTTVTRLRWSWPVSCHVLDKLHTGCMLRSIKVLLTPLRLHDQWPGSFWDSPASGNAPIQGNKIICPLRHTLHSIQVLILKHSDYRLLCYTAKNT